MKKSTHYNERSTTNTLALKINQTKNAINATESANMKIILRSSILKKNAKLSVCIELHKPLFTPQHKLLVSLENTPNLDNELISVLIKELKAKVRLKPKDHWRHTVYQTIFKFTYTHLTPLYFWNNSYFWDSN